MHIDIQQPVLGESALVFGGVLFLHSVSLQFFFAHLVCDYVFLFLYLLGLMAYL